MKLSLIFFTVLGLSVILGCLASLGTMYATSYSRLTAMAQEFTEVAQDAVTRFGGLVQDLVADSSGVVSYVISAEYNASSRRLLQTESQVTNITLDLLSYTRVASNRSRADVQRLVSSFGGFMQDVINNFGSLALYYSARLQLELAVKAQTAFNSLVYDRALAIKRLGVLYQLGIINMNRTLSAPLNSNDCILLAALCYHSSDMTTPSWLTVGTYTGGHYACHGQIGARMYANRSINGVPTLGLLSWDAYNDTTPSSQRKTWQQRCLTEQPGWEPTNMSSTCIPDRCNCGFDVRCRRWYRPLLFSLGPIQTRMTTPYIDFFSGIPVVALYTAIYNVPQAQPSWWWSSALVAAEATVFSFSTIDTFLAGLLTTNSTRLVVVLNDTQLTILGDAHGRPSSNSDPCPEWFLVRSCRPELSALGQWLLPRRFSLQSSHLLAQGALVWDIIPSTVGTVTYFTLVGMNVTVINSPIRTAQRQATAALSDIWTTQLEAMVAADANLQTYLTSVEETNVASLGAMRTAMAQEVDELADSSQRTLNESLDSSHVKLTEMLAIQTEEVRQQQAKHLAALASQLGWTVGTVLGILVAILAVGMYGTLSITHSLGTIIHSMEEAARMNLSAVADPKQSWVTEVRRIQVALHALVLRLARYKSFMPAALFEQSGPSQDSQDHTLTPLSQHTAIKLPATVRRAMEPELQLHGILASPAVIDPGPAVPMPPPQVARRTVAALAVNIMGFKGHLFHATEGFFEALMNTYITAVHETVAKVRGNLDLVLGDQLLITFNGHVRCSDAINVAAGAAVDLRAALARVQSPATLGVQMGLSVGKALVGKVGYDAFRTMLTVGTPMKLAAMLAHLSGFPDGCILTDPNIEELAKFNFFMHPVDLVHLPLLGSFAPRLAKGMPVFALEARKVTAVQEWLYQVETAYLPTDWDTAFQRMMLAESHSDICDALSEYLERHPDNVYAQRLQRRVSGWQPGRGMLLYETVDPVTSLVDSSFSDPLTPRSTGR